MSAVLWSYVFRTTLVEPPAAGQIFLNAGHPYTAATKAWISQTRADAVNVKPTLLQIPAGAVLHIQDHQYSDRWVECLTTDAVIDKDTYVEVPIAWDSNGLNLYNGNIAEVLFVTSIDLTTPPGEPTAQLVTLATAKAHLRITLPPGDPGDADIQLKLDQAEVIILGYLAERADPAWISPETAPKDVTAAILLMLARLYEHRGDLEAADADLWLAIERLLMRRRDAALA